MDAARALIGALLVRTPEIAPRTDPSPDAALPSPAESRRVGRIVEVEAYVGEGDAASHARFGRTGRNAVMYGLAGVAYVYLVYGMYRCLNVVTEPEGSPAAVLIRAVEPITGVAAMRHAREARAAARGRARPAVSDARLASGPGLLGDAFDLDVADTGSDLCDPRGTIHLELSAEVAPAARIIETPRIGIGYAAEPWRSMAWRFLDADSPSVSGRRP